MLLLKLVNEKIVTSTLDIEMTLCVLLFNLVVHISKTVQRLTEFVGVKMEFSDDCLEYNSAVWDARGVATPHPQSAQKR